MQLSIRFRLTHSVLYHFATPPWPACPLQVFTLSNKGFRRLYARFKCQYERFKRLYEGFGHLYERFGRLYKGFIFPYERFTPLYEVLTASAKRGSGL